MADAQANININLDASQALAQLRALQAEISTFQQKMLKLNASTAASAANVQRNLLNTINATGKFSAGMTTVASSTETFTNSLEKNKFSMGEYFRYAGGASKTFGKLFTNEFNTIEKVARERVKTLQTQYIKLGREANGAMKAISVRPLALDMDNLATKTMIAAQKQQILNQLLRQGSTNLLNWGKNTQWAGRQLMVGFTIPLTIFGSLAAKTFMELEEQAIRFKRVYGELFTSQEETDKMLDQLRALGSEFTKYGVALKDTMAMAADAAAMGKTGVDLLAQVSQASRLAVLGGVEQQQALETTISLTNAFGVATEDLTKKIDFLNAVENQTVVSIEDLTIAIPKAGPVVKQLGGDVEDLAFFLTAMKEGGINASEGANALKSGLASLINPSGKASEMLAGLGININAIVEGNAGDIKGTVIQFAQALDTLDPLNRARAIEQLFGKFQFSRLSTLFQNVVAEGTQASRVLGLTAASTEELAILSERELKRIESSPLFKFRKSFEDLKVAMAPVGEEFLKAVTPIIEFGTKLLEKFNSMSDGGKQFVTILVAGLGVVAPTLLMIIGLVGNGVANIAKFMLFLKGIGRGGAGIQQLGMQTEYMTQQQLEANAAASALSQTHSRLQQAFTSETAAVKALAAAYREAAIASKALMTVPDGRGGAARAARAAPKATGLAKGILSVPGPKGAGDVVPAMLSPGEAVIPADKARKYAPLISGMIAGNIPGYRFGFNPFAMMLGRSRVAARMPQSALMSMISQGPGARYSNAYKTQTGADYIDKRGKPNPKAKALRGEMEEHVFGIDQSAGAGARPTYGYARLSPIQAILNRIFGLKGKQFNAVAFGQRIGDIGTRGLIKTPSGKYIDDPTYKRDALAQYGDVDIVTKRSVSKRSTAYAGDAFLSYRHAKEYYFRGASPIAPAPMRNATQEQTKNANFDANIGARWGRYHPDPINYPKAYSERSGPDYIETHTPGGFGVNEISRIIAKDRTAKKAIQEALKASGLRIRVTDQNFATKLFQALGIPGFEDGIFSVPGPKGAGDVVPAMLSPGEAVIPTKQSKKYAGFIQSIIADKVPGYYGGLFSQTMMRLAQKQAASMKLPVGASSKTDEAVVAFGAHQPFTIAHQRIADEGMALASSQQSRFMQFTTEAFGKSKRHVLPLSTKLKLIKESLGFPATAVANPFALMEKLKSQGISKVTMLLGTDRMPSGVFDKAAAEYGITLVKKEIPRGPNDVSGTQTRIAIAKNDRAKFNELVASRASDSTKNQVFKEIAQNIKGYNNGVLSVPGPKGAGDVIPAMLSPGEAVIPAKQSQKYAGFIKSIISDNVPGFIKGNPPPRTPVGLDTPSQYEKVFAHVGDPVKMSVKQLADQIAKAGKNVPADIKRLVSSGLGNSRASTFGGLGFETRQVFNQAMADGRGVRPTDFVKDFESRGAEKWNKSLRVAGLKMDAVAGDLAKLDKSIVSQIKNAQKLDKNFVVTDKAMKKFVNKAISEQKGSALAAGLNKARKTLTEVRGSTTSKQLASSGFRPDPNRKGYYVNDKGNSVKASRLIKIGGGTTGGAILGGMPLPAEPGKSQASNTKALNNNTEQGKKTTEATTKATEATNKIVKQSQRGSQASRIESRTDRRGRTYHMLDGKRISEAQAKKAFANQERAQRGAETRAANRALAPVPSGAQQAGARGGMGMGGVGMLAMTAGMMAPMLPGKAGEVGGQLSGALMAGGMILSMAPMLKTFLLNPLTGLGVAIGGIIAAIVVWNASIKESAKRGAQLAESIGMTSKSIQTLSEFTGTVGATELRQKASSELLLGRDPFTAEQLAFGQSFMETDQGKQMLETIQRLKEEGSSASEIGSTIARNLTNAMLQGVLTEDQARGIVQALGQELGEYSIPMSITGRLTELVGVDGAKLTRDPFQLSVEIQKEAINDQAAIFEKTLDKVASNKITDFYGSKQAGIAAAVGGVAGGIIGAGAGTLTATPFGTVAGAAGGAVIGTGAGATYGAALAMEQKNTELRSMAINLGYDALELGQQQLDAIDMQYEQQLALIDAKIDQAKTEKEINTLQGERQGLTDTYRGTQDQLLSQNRQIVDSLVQQAELLGRIKFFDITEASALGMFPGMEALLGPAFDTASNMAGAQPKQVMPIEYDPAALAPGIDPGGPAYRPFTREASVDGSDRRLYNMAQQSENERAEEQKTFALQVTADFMGGNIDPFIFDQLIKAGSEDSSITRKYNVLAKEVGGAKTGQLVTLLSHYGQGPDAEGREGFKVAMDFAANNTDQMDEATEAIAILSSVDSAYGFTVDLSEEGVTERLEGIMANLALLKDYPEQIDLSTIEKDAAAGNTVFQQFLDSYGDLEGLGNVSKQFLIDFIATMNNPDLVNQYMAATGLTGMEAMYTRRAIASGDISAGDMTRVVLEDQGYTASGTGYEDDSETESGSGSTPDSWLDPIVKSSRDFGNVGQELTNGWEASLDAILKMVDGVAFATGGLAKQLRKTNIPETLVEKFLGMPPEEWEQTKKTLFDDIDGNLQLNDKGKKVMQAYASSVIADKRGEIESETASTQNQIDAFKKLRDSGYSVAEAFELITDKKLADAIMTNKNTAEVTELINAQRELAKAQEKYEEISEEKRISDSVRETNKAFAEQIQIVQKLSKERGEYSEAQIQAILDNQDLGKLFLRPGIDSGALQKALDDANKKADLELMIKKLTVVGQQDIFETGIGAAMSALSAKEREIELNFKATIADDESLIKSADEQIAKIDFELDDYQAALQEIDWAEEKINDTYQKRFDALSKVSELNDQITASKARQLDLADALSRGDIAAAAKAAQEMRSQEQSNAIEMQRSMMETAQQTEIARLRSSVGLSREQLDEKILQLEKERFGIEENTLEPAQERIRLAELQKNLQITDLEVLGKTRDEWEKIQNQVDLAQANGWRFADAMKEALNIVETLVANLMNRPLPPAPPAPAPARSSGGGSPELGQPGKGAWVITSGTNAGKTLQQAAGNQSWQEFYNANRSLDKVLAPKKASGGMIIPKRMSVGGSVKGYPMGGLIPYKSEGGFFKSLGSDTVPAMLTPGEFVVRRPAVKGFGKDNLEKINRGTYEGNSVYNYNLEVNVKSGSNPNEIANTVMRSIKQVEGRRIRGNNL